jgi:hypothetical protein
MPRRTRDNPYDILNTKGGWYGSFHLIPQSEYRYDINHGWEKPILDKIYPGWDKIYTVIDNKNASLDELQKAKDDLVFYKPPAFPDIRNYDTRKNYPDMRNHELLPLAELRNYIVTLNSEYNLMGEQLSRKIFLIENSKRAAEEIKRYNEKRELENKRYD